MELERETIGVCMISLDLVLIADFESVVDTVNDLLNSNAAMLHDLLRADESLAYWQIIQHADTYLRSKSKNKPPILRPRCFCTMDAACRWSSSMELSVFPVECLMLDTRQDEFTGEGDPFLLLARAQKETWHSRYSGMLICQDDVLEQWMIQLESNHIVRAYHPEPWHRRADILHLLLNHLEHNYFTRISICETQRPICTPP